MAADAWATGALVPILTGYNAPARPIYLLHSPRQPQPARLTALVDCMKRTFGAK